MEFLGDVHGKDPFKPSLFELVFQEQLRDQLQPAVKYVLSVFATRYPRYLLRIVNKHEEFYAFLMFWVERYYLRTYNASFAENFYGLKRRRKPLYETERANAAVGPEAAALESQLRKRDMRWSLLFLVGIPYLRAKAHDYWESVGGGAPAESIDDGDAAVRRARNSPHSVADYLRKAYRFLYPWADTAFELWLMSYNIAYLFDRTAFYRPWLKWMSVDVRRMGPEDMKPLFTAHRHLSPDQRTFSTIIRHFIFSFPSRVLDSLKIMLPASIFFIKFLQWWYSPTSPARALTQTQKGPSIPPPKMIKPHPAGILGQGQEVKYGICPICDEPTVNATALPSGYVFCYKCIYNEVESKGKCPVTLLPMRSWMLRKVLV